MNEFAKMIYEKWAEDHAESALYFDTGAELVKRIEGTLSLDLADEFYTLFCDSCKEVESNAFRVSSTLVNACPMAKLSLANNFRRDNCET